MPRDAVNIYDALISCPGDAETYISWIEKAIDDFNAGYGREHGLYVVAHHFHKDSYGQLGIPPQDAVNKQFADKCDFAIAVFNKKIGSPTSEYISGTVEEIERKLNDKKQVFPYFHSVSLSSNASQDEINHFTQLRHLKEHYKKNGLYTEFKTKSNLKDSVTRQLQQYFSNQIGSRILNSKEELIKTNLIPFFSKNILDESAKEEIRDLSSKLQAVFGKKQSSSIYYRRFNIIVNISLEDDSIVVENDYRITLVNPYRIDYTFRRNPILRQGLEYDSYEFYDVQYEPTSAPYEYYNYESKTFIRAIEKNIPTDNSLYSYKTCLEIELNKNSIEHHIHFKSKYKTDYAIFFNTYYLWSFCKRFHLHAVLHDNRTGQSLDHSNYILRWECFLRNNDRNRECSRRIDQQSDFSIDFTEDDWMFPGNGYVLTLNKSK